MKRLTPRCRLAARTGTAAFATVVAVGGMAIAAGAAGASVSASPAPSVAAANPYSPAYHHAYRQGAVPTKSQLGKMRGWLSSHPQPASSRNLRYGGGVDGIGVTTGHEKVYLVFFGSQWGTQGTDSGGNVTLSGDPSGEAPYVQKFLKGLGTNNELWSGVMTQYCEGVAAGSQTCPSSAAHVAYPTGGALAGVWVDESAASPSRATGHQLGVEAVKAASHFGNTTAAANRNAQYVIVSPHGTSPDGFISAGFCAWHDYNGDSTLSGGAVSSTVGDVSFTNLPYITDAGTSCGQNFVNRSGGTLDGVSIVEGHEYAETITDQNPAGGWVDRSGEENGDKCAWITPGTSGGSFDLSLSTGTFAVQTTWANDGSNATGACEGSHAII
jgi:serine protease